MQKVQLVRRSLAKHHLHGREYISAASRSGPSRLPRVHPGASSYRHDPPRNLERVRNRGSSATRSCLSSLHRVSQRQSTQAAAVLRTDQRRVLTHEWLSRRATATVIAGRASLCIRAVVELVDSPWFCACTTPEALLGKGRWGARRKVGRTQRFGTATASFWL